MPELSCPACKARLRLKALVGDKPILCPRCRSVVVLSEVGARLGDTFAAKDPPKLSGLSPAPRRSGEPDEDLIDYRPGWHPLVIGGAALGGVLVLALIVFLA